MSTRKSMSPQPVVIGIAGGSGSGKSTVVRHLVEAVGRDRVCLLDHDSYYRDLSHLPFDERTMFNFDHPDALETSLMCEHLDELIQWQPIEKPVYNFRTHVREETTTRVEARSVILVEGILVLADDELARRMDIKLFVDAPDDIRLLRRIQRDILERGRHIDAVIEQYQRTVRPMYLEFVEPSKRKADVIIPRGGHNFIAIEMVLSRIESLLADEPSLSSVEA